MIANCCQHEFSTPEKMDSMSQKSEKIITSCKNCSYSFRVEFSDTAEFCSKDCHTSFTLFRNNASGCYSGSNKKTKNVDDVKRDIYEFQRQVVDMDHRKARNEQQVHAQEIETRETGNLAAEFAAYEKLFKPKIKKPCEESIHTKSNFIFNWTHRNNNNKPRSQLHMFF